MTKLLKDLKIILTAVGCPGAATMIRMLRKNGERGIEVVGVDMRNDAIGRFMTDKFYEVPPASSAEYIPAMLDIVRNEAPDLLFPQSSYEVLPLALNQASFEEQGVPVLVSEPGPIQVCLDKALMYKTLRGVDIPKPRVLYPQTLDEFTRGVKELGYPERDVCFKPYVSKGGRGFRILSAHIDEAKLLLEERPNNLYMTLENFVTIFERRESFPKLLLMEYVEGVEFTVDALLSGGEILLGMVKTREAINTGLAMSFKTVNRPDLLQRATVILKEIPLDYFANVQFKGDKLLEINPRVSTFVYQDDLILPYLAIKWSLGEISKKQLANISAKVDYSRKTVRYYDQVFWNSRE